MEEQGTHIRDIQAVFMQFDRRAEKLSQDILAKTFVDAEPLFIQLSSRNHQILYGRRGTGKTHALKFLAESIVANGDVAIYIDLRTVGSNGSIYSDLQRSLPERATRLLTDVLEALEQELFRLAVESIDRGGNAEQITIRLDDVGNAIRNVEVRGSIEEEKTSSSSGENTTNAGLILQTGSSLRLDISANQKTGSAASLKTKRTGASVAGIDFGSLQTSLSGLIEVLGSPRIWLLIDEWSEVPADLQPYLADLLRRTVLPQQRVIVKIGAIEHRSRFAEKSEIGTLGIEIGADVTADTNLDDFVVYDVDQQRATEFFKNLLFKHYAVSERADPAIDTADKLVSAVFTQITAFQEFVRAVEGVPRDALNLAATMAKIAYGHAISVADVRKAAREWYQQDKMSVTKSAPALADVLSFIIDEVIDRRKTRAFLFPSGANDQRVDQLYDARLLHILKKSISSKDEAGKRYDVFKIDYGCYVDLISTVRAPGGLLMTESDEFTDEVPPDDYRSIRRSILRPEDMPA